MLHSADIAKLGMVFLGLGLCATFLMYWLWGFPFDKETRTSAAPKPLMYTHRVLGYLFIITYVAIMWHMVPRLWTYQVEFPARTVVHIVLGLTIGFLLVIKVAIMRFFRHFEEWMPYLGTAIMLFTVLLLGLSIPFVFQERALAAQAGGGTGVYSGESVERVSRLLPTSGLPEAAPLDELATVESLRHGRGVLLNYCVKCHDLKTILAKPRTPSNWHRTVERMAEKPALFAQIEPRQQWEVTAYLIAITPDLQKSMKMIRSIEEEKKQTLQASASQSIMPEVAGDGSGDGSSDSTGDDSSDSTGDGSSDSTGDGTGDGSGDSTSGGQEAIATANIDENKARETYEEICSQCHDLSDVDGAPPESAGDIDELIQRMIENDMEAEPDELALIKWYLLKRFVEKSIQ